MNYYYERKEVKQGETFTVDIEIQRQQLDNTCSTTVWKLPVSHKTLFSVNS